MTHTAQKLLLSPLQTLENIGFLCSLEKAAQVLEIHALKELYHKVFSDKTEHNEKEQTLFITLQHHYSIFWENPVREVSYQALLELKYNKDEVQIRAVLWNKLWSLNEIRDFILEHAHETLESFAQYHHAALWNPEQAIPLSTIKIPKPWGEEIWYTGMESRGVAQIRDNFGESPLPALLSLFPEALLGNATEAVILLKTLNSLKDEVLGDLYLEVHQEKWEVYIVVNIDEEAWPSGSAKIRAGFDADVIQSYQEKYGERWDTECLSDFRTKIAQYELLRREIDALLDDTDPDVQALDELSVREAPLRNEAYAFVGECTVQVGDVFCFPSGQMHSLQHGIRVVEFQTPHYERLILMFAQKVLTQSHWDTEQALSMLELGTYAPFPPVLEEESEGLKVECIVDFPDFSAYRIILSAQSKRSETLNNCYHLFMVIQGEAKLIFQDSEILLGAEDAVLIPAAAKKYQIENFGTTSLICLKAIPAVI